MLTTTTSPRSYGVDVVVRFFSPRRQATAAAAAACRSRARAPLEVKTRRVQAAATTTPQHMRVYDVDVASCSRSSCCFSDLTHYGPAAEFVRERNANGMCAACLMGYGMVSVKHACVCCKQRQHASMYSVVKSLECSKLLCCLPVNRSDLLCSIFYCLGQSATFD